MSDDGHQRHDGGEETQEPFDAASLVHNMRRALGYLRPYMGLAWATAALIVASSLFSVLTPWPLKIVIDSVLGSEPLPPMLQFMAGSRSTVMIAAVIAGFAITLISNAVSVVQNYVTTKMHEQMVLDFRSDLFQHAQRLSLAYHDRRRSGNVIFAINGQGNAAAGLVLSVPPLVQSALTLGGMFWVSMTIDATLTLLALTIVPFIYWSVWIYMSRIQTRLYRVKAMEGESLQMIHEAIQMLRVIVAFGRERHEFRRFREQGERTVNERVIVTVQQTAFSLAVNTATAFGTALVLGFGAWAALQGRLTPGQLLVLLSYIGMVYHPLEAISTTFSSLQEKIAALRVAWGLLDEVPDIVDAPDAAPFSRPPGSVVFDRVSFSYRGRKETLRDISFEVNPGETIAIVGPTGAGKTTLVSLVPRFYQAVDGRILIDGRDICGVTLESLRQSVSIVLQEPLLFAGTIADNIRYGRLAATDEEVHEAARQANAHDFVMALPEKYETVIGERGSQLSGGERQRISIARAFVKNAPILILDEPTASIDSKTEGVILDALDRLMIGRTTFMVAHRLSTIRHADRILVLNKGQLVEQGSHEELLAMNGLYRQLHDMQTGVTRRRLQLALGVAPFADAREGA